ncbi:hypothetical protein [Leisingera sp.]|nr:hypothetical protein [Leisingera sp.]
MRIGTLREEKKMQTGGSPMHIMTPDEVKAMRAAREQALKEPLAGL